MKKKTYEAVLKGFNGATDETDHLIKWGYAFCQEAVFNFFPDAIAVNELPYSEEDRCCSDFDLTNGTAGIMDTTI